MLTRKSAYPLAVIHMYIGLLVGIIMIKQEEEQGAEGPKEVLWGEA